MKKFRTVLAGVAGKKKRYKYKPNPKGNNSTRIPVTYEEIQKRIKALREEKNK